MTHDQEQAATAADMDCTVDQMNHGEAGILGHDELHCIVMGWLGTHSRSMREACGEELHPAEQRIA
jgi:hypothetical protein